MSEHSDRSSSGESIGLVAGNGQFPLLFSRAAQARGIRVYAVAHTGETDPQLACHVERIHWIHLGQLGEIISFFSSNKIHEAVFVGAVTKTRMFTSARPDERALSLIETLANTHDDGLLRAFADILEKEGITVRPSTLLLPELLAPAGCWTRRGPKASESEDMALGWGIARKIGELDIGQCVVVKRGSVLAVEAIDGTDATIRRGGRLGGPGSVVAKACKPSQDLRFDLPAVGERTVRTMSEAGATGLAIHAGKAVVFDRSDMVEFANRHGITIVGMAEE
ncbi:LpxI family protein [Thermodesulfobacteriota bacterium]